MTNQNTQPAPEGWGFSTNNDGECMSRTIYNGDHLEWELTHEHVRPEDRPDWPLPSFNARDWAKAFCKDRPGSDYELMLSWFACALMTGFDKGRAASQESM